MPAPALPPVIRPSQYRRWQVCPRTAGAIMVVASVHRETAAIRPSTAAGLVLAGLLAADLFFIWLHFANLPLDRRDLTLSREGSYSEMFEYAQLALIAVLLLGLWRMTRAPAYIAWSALFTVLLLDNWLGLHETFGGIAARRLLPVSVPLVRPKDLGEILFALGVAAVILPLLAIAFRRSDGRARRVSVLLVLLLAALAFFGIGVDLVHQMGGMGENVALNAAEDGGELIVISALLAFVVYVSVSERQARHL